MTVRAVQHLSVRLREPLMMSPPCPLALLRESLVHLCRLLLRQSSYLRCMRRRFAYWWSQIGSSGWSIYRRLWNAVATIHECKKQQFIKKNVLWCFSVTMYCSYQTLFILLLQYCSFVCSFVRLWCLPRCLVGPTPVSMIRVPDDGVIGILFDLLTYYYESGDGDEYEREGHDPPEPP